MKDGVNFAKILRGAQAITVWEPLVWTDIFEINQNHQILNKINQVVGPEFGFVRLNLQASLLFPFTLCLHFRSQQVTQWHQI